MLYILHTAFLVAAHKNFDGAARKKIKLFKAAHGIYRSPKRALVIHNAAADHGVAVVKPCKGIGRILPVASAGNNVKVTENAHLFAAFANVGYKAEIIAVFNFKAIALRQFLCGF